jgi:hypothetical protein
MAKIVYLYKGLYFKSRAELEKYLLEKENKMYEEARHISGLVKTETVTIKMRVKKATKKRGK